MNYNIISQDKYAAALVDLMGGVEGFVNHIYDANDHTATIGYGYNITAQRNNVALFDEAGIVLTPAQRAALSHIDAMPRSADAYSYAYANLSSLRLTKSDASNLLMAFVNHRVAPSLAGLNIPDYCMERVSLTAYVYNRGHLPEELRAYLSAGDRAGAWFFIRYDSQTLKHSNQNGIAKGRFQESQVFSLYDNPSSVSPDEAQHVLETYTNFKTNYAYLNKNKKLSNEYNSEIKTLSGLSANQYEAHWAPHKWLYPDITENLVPAYTAAGKQIPVKITPRFSHLENFNFLRTKDPLLLDLSAEGSGILDTALSAHFDHSGNGFAELTGWVGKDTGLLVYDVNNGGIITAGEALVGDGPQISEEGSVLNGFEVLKKLAGQGLDILDNTNAIWGQLKVWVGSDGTPGSGKLMTLDEAGILSISLTPTSVQSGVDSAGNTVNFVSTFTMADGSVRTIGDYSFQVNPTDTWETNVLDVPDNIKSLPEIVACGTVYDLSQAMVRDDGLSSLVSQLIATTDVAQVQALVTSILERWTGANSTTRNSATDFMDARHLQVVEQFRGADFTADDLTLMAGNGAAAASQIEAVYQKIYDYVLGALVAQGPLKALWDGTPFSISPSDAQTINTPDFSAATTYFDSLRASDPGTAANELALFAEALKGLSQTSLSGYADFKAHIQSEQPELTHILDAYDGSGNVSVVLTSDTSDFAAAPTSITGGYLYNFNGSGGLLSHGGNILIGEAKTVYEVANGDIVDALSSQGEVWFGNEKLTGGQWNKVTQQFESANFAYKLSADGSDSLTVTNLADPTQSITLENVPIVRNGDGSFALASPYLGLDLFSDAVNTINISMGDVHPYSIDTTINPYDFWMTWASGFSDRVNIVEPGGRYNLKITDLASTAIMSDGVLDGTKALAAISSRVSIRDFQVAGNGNVLENIIFSDGVTVPIGSMFAAPEIALPDQATVAVSDSDSGTIKPLGKSNTYVVGAVKNNIEVAAYAATGDNADQIQFSTEVDISDLSFNQDGEDLLIVNSKQGTVMKVGRYFSSDTDTSVVKPFTFASGLTLSYAEVSNLVTGEVSPAIQSSKALFALVGVTADSDTGTYRLDISGAEAFIDGLFETDAQTAATYLTQFSTMLRPFAAKGEVDFNAFREHFLNESRDYGWAIDSSQNLAQHFDNFYGGYDAQPWISRTTSGDVSAWGGDFSTLFYGADGHSNFSSRTQGGQFIAVGGDKDSNLVAYSGGLMSSAISANTLDGGLGDDILIGGTAANFLDGHGGQDLIQGGSGANTYYISSNNGNACIRNTRNQADSTVDIIEFDSDVSSDGVAYYQQGSDLLIVLDTGQKTLVEGYFAPVDANGNVHTVSSIKFADGTELSPPDVAALVTPLDGDSHILQAPTDDQGTTLKAWYDGGTLIAGSGDDTLIGSRGDDVLVAGSGSSVMSGRAGRNTYQFGSNTGSVVLDNTAYFGASSDIISFVDGITASDLAFKRSDNDLVLTLKQGGCVTVKEFFDNAYQGNLLSSVVFSDGTAWSRNDIISWLEHATADNKTAYALPGPINQWNYRDYLAWATVPGSTLYANPGNLSFLYGSTTPATAGERTTYYGAAGQQAYIVEGSGDNEVFTHPGAASSKGFLEVLAGTGGNTLIHAEAGDGVIYMANFSGTPNNRIEVDISGNIRPQDVIVDGAPYVATFNWGTRPSYNLSLDYAQLYYNAPDPRANGYQDPAEMVRFENGLIWDKTFMASGHGQIVGDDKAGDFVQYTASGNNSVVYAGDGDDVLMSQLNNAWLFGGAGNDTFYGNVNTVFSGGWGHNTIQAGSGLSIIDGGKGGADVFLNWNQSSQAVIFVDSGAGNDNVWLSQGSATVRFDFGVTASDVDFIAEPGNSLKMVLKKTGQYVDVQNWFEPWNAHDVKVEFLDGSTFSYGQITALLPGNGADGDVTIYANDSSTVLQAGNGNDTLYSSYNGTETIIGGAGNDTIYVQGGTHEIKAGSGATSISVMASSNGQTFDFGYDNSAINLSNNNWQQPKNDVIKMGEGITQNDVSVSLVSHYWPAGTAPMSNLPMYEGDLQLQLSNGAKFTIDNAVMPNPLWVNPIDAVQFSDGTTWTYRDLLSRIELHPDASGQIQLPAGVNMAMADAGGSPLIGGDSSAGLFSYYSGSYLKAGSGAETVMEADKGFDILQGGPGVTYMVSQGGYYDHDTWQYFSQPSLLYGGSGSSVMSAGDAVVVGGKGDSSVQIWGQNNTVLFNKGDGTENLTVWSNAATISLGGGLTWNDIVLKKVGTDLVLETGANSGNIDIQHWYDGWDNQAGLNLQLFTNLADEATGAPAQAQLLHLADVVAAFDSAQAQNPALTEWSLGAALQQFTLTAEQGAAIGGDLAHYYALEGTLSGMSVDAVQACLAGTSASQAQVLHSIDNLQQGQLKILP